MITSENDEPLTNYATFDSKICQFQFDFKHEIKMENLQFDFLNLNPKTARAQEFFISLIRFLIKIRDILLTA
jgi:hypothetical protein